MKSLYDIQMLIADKKDISTQGLDNERQVRKYISQLRLQGTIYIPVLPRVYRHIENCSKEQIEHFVNQQLAHMKKQYFHTLKPLKNALQDVRLKEKIGELDLWL